MTPSILNLDLHRKWYHQGDVWVIGKAFNASGILLDERGLAESIQSCKLEDEVRDLVSTLNGSFAILINGPGRQMAITDRWASYPIFYRGSTKSPGEFALTDKLLPEIGTDIPLSVRFHFQYLACTPQGSTLLPGWQTVMPGHVLSFSSGKLVSNQYFSHEKGTEGVPFDPNRMLQLLDSLADGMIEYLGDRRAVIGLSGGMDSALPLALLLRKGFRKIACFTYGAGRTRDVRNAHYLADSAGVDWEFVEYGKQTFESFGSPSWNAFSEIAHSCFRVPYEQDYFALERLLEKGTLDPERDVIISGFLGDHLGGSFHVFGHGQPGAGDVCGAILDKYVLRGMPQELNANLSGIFADPKCNLGRYQSWLAVHRHAGFILGGLEAFRFFGFDYYVPAMDHDWTDFWYGLDWSERLYSQMYRKGLLEGLFKPLGMGRAFREEAPLIKRLKRDIKGMVPVHVRARLKSVARAGEDVLGYKFLYGNIKSEVSGGGEQFYGNINLIHAAYLLERYSGPLK